jgi:hypothetical protein
MMKTASFLIVLTLLSGLTVVSVGAEGRDIHSTLFECTTCHVRTPMPGETLESAPLVKPKPDLCLMCHGDTHGG